jgi:hypothetical protein
MFEAKNFIILILELIEGQDLVSELWKRGVYQEKNASLLA